MRALPFALLFLSSSALAQDVLVVHGSPYISDIQAKLIGTGAFTSVDVWDGSVAAPTLNDLANYNAVMVVPDFVVLAGLDQVLVDYINIGGGVVDTIFTRQSPLPAFIGLSPLQLSSNPYGYGPVTLGSVVPGSPVGAGVTSFAQQDFWDGVASVTPGATLDITLSNGAPLAAHWAPTGAGTVVALNMYSPSTDIRSDFWDATTDGDLIMANALLTAAGIPSTFFDLSVTGSCPGPTNFSVSNGTPNGAAVLVSGTGPGSFTVPSGNCAGIVIPFARPTIRAQFNLNGAGGFSTTPNIANPAVCGAPVAAIDLTTCEVSTAFVP